MPEQFVIDDIQKALAGRVFPCITLWNRLEGRPRSEDFDRALKAEVRDALWMLTKQWQLGEFQGDDAGSPVFAKMHVATTRLAKYQPDGRPVQAFEDDVPLEARVEQRALPFRIGEQPIALDLRLQMGRKWLKMLQSLGDFEQDYLDEYPIALPDPSDEADAQVCAHPEVWSQVAAVAGRAMDGAALYAYLTENPAHHAYDGISVPEFLKPAVDGLAVEFVQWFEDLYYQPHEPETDAWMPSYLEYQFFCSAPEGEGEKVFAADEYYHGHFDWYNLDIDPERDDLGEVPGEALPDPQATQTESFVPVPVTFEGMPHTRWWRFEDRRTNFGDIEPDTTDLAKLLLIEFGLVYANDWFLFPLSLPVGSIASVRGLALTNVFGERFWIEPAGRGADDAWQRWRMFTLNIKGREDLPADLSLVLLPTVPKIQESGPLEQVALIRDEVANMVWGIETTVPRADGTSAPGRETALQLRGYLQALLDEATGGGVPPETPLENEALIRYQVMTSVPEHWIPFIPVHVEDDIREIQLQRAAMPRLLAGDPDPPEKVRPRTVLLREGLDRDPPEGYYVHEEEVPRAGVRVSQSFQRTRWYDGRVFVWLGVRKQTGRGEGSSGLAFDQILPVD